MDTDSCPTNTALEETTKASEVNVSVNAHSTALEYFFRFLVVAAGIILAGIAALTIGLFTGWIPIC